MKFYAVHVYSDNGNIIMMFDYILLFVIVYATRVFDFFFSFKANFDKHCE